MIGVSQKFDKKDADAVSSGSDEEAMHPKLVPGQSGIYYFGFAPELSGLQAVMRG